MAERAGTGTLGTALQYAVPATILVLFFAPRLTLYVGLSPAAVFEGLRVWQPVTYMFAHRDLFHILFNMLALWMFGVELERLWGTQAFTRYYFVTGVGAGLTTLLFSLLPPTNHSIVRQFLKKIPSRDFCQLFGMSL